MTPRPAKGQFLPLCDPFIEKIARARPSTKATYRSNFSNPAVTKLLDGKSVLEVATMDDEVKHLLNVTIGTYSDDYRGVIRRVITGTLDECVRKGTIPRHTLTGIELAPQIVTAEQYEARSKGMVSVDDDTVRMLAEGITVTGQDRNGRKRTRVMNGLGIAPWLQRTMGLRIREALGVRRSDFMTRPDGTRYLHLMWQASENGREHEPLKHRQAGDFRDVPVPGMVWDMVAGPTGRAALPRPERHPLHAVLHRPEPVQRHRGIPGDQRSAHPFTAPPVRQRGPRRQPQGTRQHQPGTRTRLG